jgi:streptogramin lyase
MAKVTKLMSFGLHAEAAKAIVGQVQSAAMAGSTAATATVITGECVLITTSSAGGLALPASNAGDTYLIKNEGGATCTLYPSATAGTVTINATTSLSIGDGKSVLVFFSSGTACHSIPTVAS